MRMTKLSFLIALLAVSSAQAETSMFSAADQTKGPGQNTVLIPGLNDRDPRSTGASTPAHREPAVSRRGISPSQTTGSMVAGGNGTPKLSSSASVTHTIIPAKETPPQRPVKTQKVVTKATDADVEPLYSPRGQEEKARALIANRLTSALGNMGADPLDLSSSNQNGEDKNTISVRSGVTEIIPISKNYLTRVTVPFKEPEAKTINDVDVDVVGNTLFITPQSEGTIGLFVYDKSNPQVSISLHLVPQDIPQRNITLNLATSRGGASVAGAYNPDAESFEHDQPFTSMVVSAFAELAKGRLPSGYSLAQPRGDEAVCQVPGMAMRLGQMVDGSTYRIAVFATKNISDRGIEINEDFCYHKGVVAAASWPLTYLEPGEQTEVYVMFKYEVPVDAGSIRPSTIDPVSAR